MDSHNQAFRDIQKNSYKKRVSSYKSRVGYDMLFVNSPKKNINPKTIPTQPNSKKDQASIIAIKPLNKKINKRRLFLYLSIILITSSVIFANAYYIYSNNQLISSTTTQVLGETSSTDDIITNSSTDVDESDISMEVLNGYKVADNLPRYIYIDKIGVKARVIRVGIDKENEIESPKSIFNAGWYEGSNTPDEPGAVFIDGHVSGPTKKGIFYNLNKLSKGDVIAIETGNGKVFSYIVQAKEYVSPDTYNVNKALVSIDPDKQGLNLMTCYGEFNKNTNQYEERLVIYTTKI